MGEILRFLARVPSKLTKFRRCQGSLMQPRLVLVGPTAGQPIS